MFAQPLLDEIFLTVSKSKDIALVYNKVRVMHAICYYLVAPTYNYIELNPLLYL